MDARTSKVLLVVGAAIVAVTLVVKLETEAGRRRSSFESAPAHREGRSGHEAAGSRRIRGPTAAQSEQLLPDEAKSRFPIATASADSGEGVGETIVIVETSGFPGGNVYCSWTRDHALNKDRMDGLASSRIPPAEEVRLTLPVEAHVALVWAGKDGRFTELAVLGSLRKQDGVFLKPAQSVEWVVALGESRGERV